jgi:phenylacetate-CoA ligase
MYPIKEGINRIIRQIRTKKASFWSKVEANQALHFFRLASKNVPAYQDFLRRHKIKPGDIKTVADFHPLPIVDKKNYLRKYSLSELAIGGRLDKPLVFTATSGSTGAPFYFHRSFDLDLQTATVHELFYLHGQYRKYEPVLAIICFGMGVWIGGIITYQAFRLLQERDYNISVITPGINKLEIFNSLKNLGKEYKNIILAGYPPFIKDIIDEAPRNGIDWRKFRVRLLFAAEVFTEDFRDYVCKAANIKNPLLDTMNIYGTAELGAMAFETPLSILIRRLCVKSNMLFESIFKKIQKTPTLCQYIPSFISFEADNDDVVISGYNTLPLVRYSIGDHGGVHSFSQVQVKFNELGVNLKKEVKKAGIEKYWYKLPFVYVYERADFSTNLYGLQVYPEPVREALLKKSLSTYLTGKFTLETRFDSKQNQYLLIHLEMRKSNNNKIPPPSIRRAIVNAIIEQLELKNSEYRELHKFLGKRALPRLQFWPAEDPKYFKPGIKQKWIKK